MKRFLKYLAAATIVAFCANSAQAATHTVGSAEEIAALKILQAGDVVILKKGEWKNQSVSLRAEGTAGNPVIVMAEEAGAVVFTGSSRFRMSGNHINVSGLNFKDITLEKGQAVIDFRTNSTRMASNSTVSDCSIEGDGLEKSEVDFKWVSIYGRNNTVKNCSFTDKFNMGTTLIVWLSQEEEGHGGHTITGNYFTRPRAIAGSDGEELNGQETVRVGDSHTSMQDANCVIENNYFYQCNGEVEIISNKSCGNIYRNNVFVECIGALTLRHGNRCTVDGNWFFGNKTPRSGGVRIIGEDHVVVNNYFENLLGIGYRSAISLIQGEADSKLNGYFAAKNALVAFNTIIDCKVGIGVNYRTSRQTLPVHNNTIAANIIYTKNAKFTTIDVKDVPEAAYGMTWENNISLGGRIEGISPKKAGVLQIDPIFVKQANVSVPAENSPLGGKLVSGYPDVKTDIAGRAREEDKKVIGAMNLSGNPVRTAPTAKTTGVNWKR